MKVIEGNAVGTELKVGIVVARFNEFITSKLLEGATDTLRRHGVTEGNITVMWVPGEFEIPLAAKKLAEDGAYHAVITLGAVSRGASVHFDYACNATDRGVSHVSLHAGIPVTFGVVTTETIEAAIERGGTDAVNKGADAAPGAIEMANLMQSEV